MRSIGRYIARTVLGAFVLVLASLTIIIWMTHAIRDIDIVTNQGQTILVFLGLTSLVVPMLVLVIAPIALVIAVIYTLNKLNADSEIAVMSAAGMSPWRIFTPFLAVALLVAALAAALGGYLSPKCLRELRIMMTQVRANLIANIIQPGRFTPLQGGLLTFHIRERRANGELGGIFIDDRRDPSLRSTFLAERGMVVDNDNGSFLVLEKGSAQRVSATDPDPTIVLFERYAFDMTQFSGADAVPTFSVRERYPSELISPDPQDPLYKQYPGQFRAEMHDRMLAPVYPVVFTLIAFAILGAPRTNRQSRGLSILMTVLAVGLVRLAGFAGVVFVNKTAGAIYPLYALLLLTAGGSLVLLARGTVIEAPVFLTDRLAAWQARFGPRQATA
jgi:lipopolysaccharide export system permease protein